MASNFNRGNESSSSTKRTKINIERNDLSDKASGGDGFDGFAMPDPEDDFWKPVVPGGKPERKTDLYDEEDDDDGAEGRIASACARLRQSDYGEGRSRSPRYKSTNETQYLERNTLFGGYEREPSFSQRRRNPSPAEDVDLLSFDEPTFKFPILTPTPLLPLSGVSSSPRHQRNASPSTSSENLVTAATATSSSAFDDVLESSKQMLYEMFSHVPRSRIDSILAESNGSITQCTDLLLEYPQQIQEFEPMEEFLPNFPPKNNGFSRTRNLSGPSATVTSATQQQQQSQEFGGILPNSIRHSRTNYLLGEEGSEEVRLGIGATTGRSNLPETHFQTRTSTPESENYGTLEETDDLFVPIDGEDWFDFQLTPGFVRDLFNAYSEPGRLTAAEMTADSPELKIRIPPKLAFKLYQMLALNMMQKALDRERRSSTPSRNTASSSASFDYDAGERQGFPQPEEKESELESFLKEEMKLSLRDIQSIRVRRDQIRYEMAVKLTLAKLKALFPAIPEAVVERTFEGNDNQFEETVKALTLAYGSKLDGAAFEDEFPGSEEIILETVGLELVELRGLSTKFGVEEVDESELSAEDWRNKATKHHVLRSQYQQKGQNVAAKGLTGGLAYYTKMYNLHTDRMLHSNAKAASIIMDEFKRRHGNKNVIDLHHLYAAEAVDALHNGLAEYAETMNKERINRMEIRVITGRGNNSSGGKSILTPTVVSYLRNHHYSFLEMDGSVVVTLKTREDKYTY